MKVEMKALAGTIAALAMMGSTAANAQVYADPAPYYAPGPVVAAPPPVVVAPGPVVVAPAPYIAPGYEYGYNEPYIVDPRTGRWCRIESNGYRWCWTP
jgi:hypothetical protein